VQYHALKGGHDYGQYVRDAENAGETEIADFFRQVMEEDSARAHRCHEFLARLGEATTRPRNAAPRERFAQGSAESPYLGGVHRLVAEI
jgi:rubrerythrin